MQETRKFYDLSYDGVTLQEEELKHAFVLEKKYLLSLDVDRLLSGFRETAGIKPVKEAYAGWERTEIRGHTLGHYLTAVSQAYRVSGEEIFLNRAVCAVDGLAACQAVDGYLFAWDREIFDRVEQKKPAWVPWYTMHKILGGLLSAYRLLGYEPAYAAALRLGEWIYNRCRDWDEARKKVVLSVEYGGMNDVLYELYELSGEQRFLAAAHQFDELELFQKLHDGEDILNGLHANTTIPKILGALRRYLVLGEEAKFYRETAEQFWELVVSHHTYITGGNSEWEHFGEPDILDAERTACNCETCNTYNMLKLSKLLYEITGEKKYTDYYERAWINAILSSQNPETGMTTYFQPMASGYFKVYSTPYESFWCCTGSGMENFTKLLEGKFFADASGEILSIEGFESARVVWKNQLSLETKKEIKEHLVFTVKVQEAQKQEMTLRVRIPDWLDAPEKLCGLTPSKLVAVEEAADIAEKAGESFGEAYPVSMVTMAKPRIMVSLSHGFLELRGRFYPLDRFTFTFPMKLMIKTLPDHPDTAAFQFGPYVLSAGLGNAMMDTAYTGVDVLVPEKNLLIRDYIVLEEMDCQNWKTILKGLLKRTGPLEFTLSAPSGTLVFTPHYRRYQERYGIYFRIYAKGSKELSRMLEKEREREARKAMVADVIPVGNDQYELAHHIQGEKTYTRREDGHCCRYCMENGWFSYRFALTADAEALCVLWKKGKENKVWADTKELCEIGRRGLPEDLVLVEYRLPGELPHEENTVTLRFQNNACVYDELLIKRRR